MPEERARFAAFGNGRMVKVFVQLTTAFHSGNKGVNNISRQDVDHTYLASMADLRVPIHSPFSGHGAEVPVTTRTARLRSAFALRKAGSSLYAPGSARTVKGDHSPGVPRNNPYLTLNEVRGGMAHD
jgi:hypothetical protein